MIPPSARMVTPLAPVKVVKSAQVQTATTARPPGIQPKMPRAARKRRWEAPPSARTYPATVRSGMAGSVEEVTSAKVCVGTAATGVPAMKKSKIAKPAMMMKTGAPRRNAPRRAIAPGHARSPV